MKYESLSKLLEIALDDMDQAADSESLDRTIFFGNRAQFLLLRVIFDELHQLRSDIKQYTDRI